jgi:hypothetical protein
MRSDPESLGGTSRIFTFTHKFGWLQGSRNLLIRQNLGCGGPLRTEYAISEHSFPQRIAALRRASLTNNRDS